MVFEVVDEFGVLSVFSCEHILQFEDWSVNFNCTVLLKNLDDAVDNLSSDGHLMRVEVTGALGNLDFELISLQLFLFLFGLAAFVLDCKLAALFVSQHSEFVELWQE